MITMLVQILVGLTVGTLFLHARHNYQGIEQRTGYFNFAIATLIFTSNEALPIFLQERQIFIRESSRGAYRASSYVLSQAATMLPFLFLLATLFSATSYFLVGLVATPAAFLMFVLIVFLTLCVANSFVSFVASVVPDMTGSQTIVLALDAYFYLFSGLFIPRYVDVHPRGCTVLNMYEYT
jgi:ABC-type multidrug transport system permease subunit